MSLSISDSTEKIAKKIAGNNIKFSFSCQEFPFLQSIINRVQKHNLCDSLVA